VAPTKPLVAQQIEACHNSCGIPGTDAIELTGQIPREMRAVHVSLKPLDIAQSDVSAVEK
jgi:ERCC4-related helicase